MFLIDWLTRFWKWIMQREEPDFDAQLEEEMLDDEDDDDDDAEDEYSA